MAQTVRALVVGIDAYAEQPDLAGAVNDARDIARALQRLETYPQSLESTGTDRPSTASPNSYKRERGAVLQWC